MEKEYQTRFIRFLKELNIYSQFIKNINHTRENADEIGLGFCIIGIENATISSYLDYIRTMDAISSAFTWSNTTEGDLYWRTIGGFWRRACTLPLDMFQSLITSFNVEDEIRMMHTVDQELHF